MDMKEKIANSAKWYYNLGLEKAKEGNLTGATANLKTSLFFNKNDVDARNLLGLIYFQTGQIVDGLAQWVISSNLKQDNNVANDYLAATQANATELDRMNQVIKKYNQALTYAKQGDEDLAMLQVKKVVSIMPNFIDAQLLMALLLIHQDNTKEAYERIQDVLAIDRKNSKALDFLQEVEKPEEEVIADTGEKVIEKPKKEKGAVMERFEKGLWGRGPLLYVIAGIIVGVIVSMALVYPTIKRSSAASYQSQIDDYKEQILAKDTQLKSNEKNIKEANSAKKKAEEELKSYIGDAKTEGLYDKLLTAMDAYSQKDYSTAAINLNKINRKKLATKKMKKVYDNLKVNTYTTTVATNLYARGYSAYVNGDNKSAIEYLTLSIDINSSKLTSYLYLGRAYESSKDKKKAISTYKTIVEKFPGTNTAKDAQARIDAMEKKNTATKKLN